MNKSAEYLDLEREFKLALSNKNIATVLEKPAKTVNSNYSLIQSVAIKKILTERQLSNILQIIHRNKNRYYFSKLVDDDVLGFETLRAWWRIISFLRDNDPNLDLEYIICEYRKSDLRSIIRNKWFHIILTQSYNESNWYYALAWIKIATYEEIRLIPNSTLYGVLIGLMNEGYWQQAKDLMERKSITINEFEALFFLVPNYHLNNINEVQDQPTLVKELNAALPNRGKEWDWLCNSYINKIKTIKEDYLDIRVNGLKAQQLKDIILKALKCKQPLSFQRMGDGAVYHWPLPSIAKDSNQQFIKDDSARELSWWNKNIDEAKGEFFSRIVHTALCNADILGIISAYRLIRDANTIKIVETITGRALLAHVEAVATHIPIENKIITEDRAHTILYTVQFLAELIDMSENIVVVGGLSLQQMNLKCKTDTTFIELIPEQNKGLPTTSGARSIIDDFDSISEDLRNACKPGTLALISGGYVGKALVDLAKVSGAVALDIGSRADSLAGYATRSPADAVLN